LDERDATVTMNKEFVDDEGEHTAVRQSIVVSDIHMLRLHAESTKRSA
jgi:hypothetical protein